MSDFLTIDCHIVAVSEIRNIVAESTPKDKIVIYLKNNHDVLYVHGNSDYIKTCMKKIKDQLIEDSSK